MRLVTLSATHAVSSPFLEQTLEKVPSDLSAGLYYKLHGAHRPVTMKKSVIKRRKRVIPASQEAAEGASTEPADSPSPGADTPTERGSMNPDGSVNLGSKGRPGPPLTLVPEAVLRQNRQSSPLHSGDLTQYHSSPTSQPKYLPESLTNENRLAPLQSIGIPTDRKSSLSPASFLSPPRKRSFSSTDMEFPTPLDADNSKRLSSIKSILNSAATRSASDDTSENRLRPMRTSGGTSSGIPSPQSSSYDAGNESDKVKAGRRMALQREAESMREMLAAKERELAELGM